MVIVIGEMVKDTINLKNDFFCFSLSDLHIMNSFMHTETNSQRDYLNREKIILINKFKQFFRFFMFASAK